MEKKKFKIRVLEDNRFYNRLITGYLERYTEPIAQDYAIEFDIFGYMAPGDFLEHLPEDTNMAVVDYYLGDDSSGLYVLKKIKRKCKDCKVFIISSAETIRTSLATMLDGASGFILKDQNALSNASTALEEMLKTQGYVTKD